MGKAPTFWKILTQIESVYLQYLYRSHMLELSSCWYILVCHVCCQRGWKSCWRIPPRWRGHVETKQHPPSKVPRGFFLGVQPLNFTKNMKMLRVSNHFGPWIQPWLNRWPGSCGNCGFWDPKRDVGGFDQGN